MYGTYAIFCSLRPVLRIPNNTERDLVLYVILLDRDMEYVQSNNKMNSTPYYTVSQLPEHYHKIYSFVI